MTAFGSVHTAVEAMKIGAFDYVQKPFEIEEMELKIEKALEHPPPASTRSTTCATRSRTSTTSTASSAPAARCSRCWRSSRRSRKSNTTVLIRGETGTGKELIAGAIHHNSLRAARNFVKVNCAALQENLLESELFGHEKGAFTGADKQRIGRFEQADGGTLFLDEVGDMSPNTQAKILRVLQEHEFERLGGTRTLRVDVRVIAATNRNLPQMVARRPVPRGPLLPPERRLDRDAAAARAQGRHRGSWRCSSCSRFAGELKKQVDGLDARRAEAADALQLAGQHPRAGELDRARRAAGRRPAGHQRPICGSASCRRPRRRATAARSSRFRRPASPLEEIERQALIEALKMSNWVQKDAAELLGISPRVMNYKIKTLAIEYPRGRRPIVEVA